jgi:signal transduction histidine kinase
MYLKCRKRQVWGRHSPKLVTGGGVRPACPDNKLIRTSDRLALSVDDTGPGIAQEDRERVLDRFYRVAGKETIGSGLGLAIVKSIADVRGAALSLERSQHLGGLRWSSHAPPLHHPGVSP